MVLDDEGVWCIGDLLEDEGRVNCKAAQQTIRRFAEEQLAGAYDIPEVRARRARHYTAQTEPHADIFCGPQVQVGSDWVDVGFANLRAGFRRAAEHHDVESAANIAAHTSLLALPVQRYESAAPAE
jgi:hypothetical protein